MKRLYSLDYLRGFSALGIMLYHYSSWVYNSSELGFLKKVGIYGVSTFYILSGLTLYHVYFDKMKPTFSDVLTYWKKRLLRIFPLLWLATIATIIIGNLILHTKTFTAFDLFLNFSGLFGFIPADNLIALGVWSIGNELVFYMFFPFFVWAAKASRFLIAFVSILTFIVYVYFAFAIFTPDSTLAAQWNNYTNPFNQLFLFLGGFLLGLVFNDRHIKNSYVILSILGGLTLFIFYPIHGTDKIALITGLNRLALTTACFLICFGFYKLPFKLSVVHRPLAVLGEISYSVYLLHPIVYSGTSFLSKKINLQNNDIRITSTCIIALIVCYFVYNYFELFFMRLGQKKVQSTTSN